jgi:hypothetical protein
MRPLTSHFRDDALTTLDTVLKQTKEARIFRRAQAVREVVAGHYVSAVSATLHFRHGAEITSRFISACIIASAPEHFSVRVTHC